MRADGARTTVVLVGTLDTKGLEYRYFRDRLVELGVDVVLVDAGIVGEPLGRARHHAGRGRRRRRRGRRGPGGRRRSWCRSRDDGARSVGDRGAAARRGSARRGRCTRRLRWLGDRDDRDATTPDRRAEAHGLDRRVGRHESVRRLGRHHDDVLRRRHRRCQSSLCAHHLERGRRARRNGAGRRAGARRDAAARWSPRCSG